MAKAIPNPELTPNGSLRKQMFQDAPKDPAGRSDQSANGKSYLASLDFWGPDHGEPAENQELLNTLGIEAGNAPPAAASKESEHLQVENLELRSIIAELQQALEESKTKVDSELLERQKEYESLLEEKSELIRSLHVKIQELQEQHKAVPPTPKEEELLAMSEELERERCKLQQEKRQLEEERRQLEDDEQIMTKQMREMEVQMARERADFARQRTELNRIHEELRREMDNIERNGLLNQRLGLLRQRSQDLVAGHGPGPTGAAAPQEDDASRPAEPKEAPAQKRKETFLGRIFG